MTRRNPDQDHDARHEPDGQYMELALGLAQRAASQGEVPVGAVIVDNNDQVIGRGFNLREQQQDPTVHAEMTAIKEAAKELGSWRLTGCTLYVTLEPCVMCAGAIVLARIDRLVYATADPKGGAVDTLYQVTRDERLNHQVQVTSGTCEAASRELLQSFFRHLRAQD